MGSISNFTGNKLHKYSYIGAVAMSGVNIEFWAYRHFSNNTPTALMVNGTTVNFTSSHSSVTVFQDNSSLHGGAIY